MSNICKHWSVHVLYSQPPVSGNPWLLGEGQADICNPHCLQAGIGCLIRLNCHILWFLPIKIVVNLSHKIIDNEF